MSVVESAVPVAIHLPEPLATEVAAWVEGEVGWQVVTLDGPLQPVLVLTGSVQPDRRCAVVVDGVPDPEQVRDAFHAGAVDVIGWPAERARLLRVASTDEQVSTGGPRLVRVAGTGGGAGTSTVTLALAGLLAWSGRRVVVIGAGDLLGLCGAGPWRGPGAADVAALAAADAAAEVEALTRPVPGVPGLRVLGGPGAAVRRTAGWPADLAVADLRTPDNLAMADLVVSRSDRSVVAAAAALAPVVVRAGGALEAPAVRRLLGRAPAGWLSWSARVARAGAAGAVPAGLPGSWLHALAAVLRDAGAGVRRAAS